MNRRADGFILVAVLLLVGIAILFMMDNRNVFTVNQVRHPDSYTLMFNHKNQTDSHFMSLSEGDALSVDFAVNKGRADLTIGIDGKEPIYIGNDLESGAFTLYIPAAGQYRIPARATYAAGLISVLRSNGGKNRRCKVPYAVSRQ